MGRVILTLALTMVLTQPGFSNAATLVCRPGVAARSYAVRYIGVFIERTEQLHETVGKFAVANGLSVSSVEGMNPNKTSIYNDKTTFLQSANFGTVITIRTDNRKNIAKITIGNNCWAPDEDWRPYWKKLSTFLMRAGYKDAAKPSAEGQLSRH